MKAEENVALASKGKAKKGPNQGQGSKGGEKKKKDPSKIKCFKCGEFGLYSTQCPQRKKDKKEKQVQTTTSVEIDELTSRLEEFALVAATPPDGGGA